jgi:FecR protein
MKNRLAVIVEILTLTFFALGTAIGQDNNQVQGQAQGQSEEPSSSVARISLMHGDVSTQRGDSSDWTAAVLNQPVLASDKVSTGVGSRTEVQLDGANVLRLGDNTLASIASLSRNQIQVQVSRGLIDYVVFKGTEAQVEIDTANASIHPSQKDGVYRIEVNSEGETQVIARKGEADISTPEGSTHLDQGRMIVVRGTAEQAQYREDGAPSKDSWDSWNNDRDHAIRDAQSWDNTNRNYVGSEDLDANGRWQNVPDYGPVWAPTVAPGWAPYRAGRWVWEPGWGWTWVSYEPWGWAPYHYGRWFLYNSSWVWWPGPAYGYPRYRPVWAPAYVSFFGFGGGVGVGVGFGFGSVGWLPIGPCDRFYPWYGRYGSHFNSVNVVNITNINIHNGPGRDFGGFAPLRSGNGYSNLRLAAVNERVRQGVSTVSADRFGTGRQVPGGVSREDFNRGRMMAGNLPVVPSREALSASNRPAAVGTMQRGVQQQRFFTKSQPGPRPQSFDRQAAQVQQAIQRNGQFKPITAAPSRGVANTTTPGGQFSRGNGATSNPATGSLGTGNTDMGRSAVPRPSPGVRMGANTEPRGGFSNAQPSNRGTGSTADQSWRQFGSRAGQNQPGGQNQAGGQNQPAARGTLASPANSSQRGDAARSSAPDSGGWRRFSGPSSSQPGNNGGVPRSPMNSSSGGGISGVPRPGNSGGQGPSGNNEGWRQQFPQQSRGTMDSSSGVSRGSAGRGSVQDSPRTYSRPPLEMRQPIVTPRSPEGMGGSARGAASSPSPSRGGGGYNNGGGGHAQPGGGGGGGNRGGGGGGSPHSGGSGHRR